MNLLTLESSEAERIAYTEGFMMAAELFKRIDDLQSERDALKRENDILIDQLHDLQLKGDYS
jgi:predicted  nucleic acid-binding Zn-ribbon protein